ncbi:hypothetical protein CEP89_01120 [Streptobacillus moniliformis]|uniref:Uncharacterized protein n=6 Tax=Streptobacillus moniliformis TaxID=34105 RepID=D1AXR0_STRM9|nr:hypothetical protein [Streptobacillus moniliformis]ACZ01086.1 hypothetical protein Smon_0608 [Streptobacillus moniliformis DSM 12112]AVL42548.1 hypothetical protein CEP89_01120 [Streptobacillus moniliformis]SQA13772.1 Uncharacterised protein [Streptobacillus moniliformis]
MDDRKLNILPCSINEKDTHFVYYETEEFTIWVSIFIEGEGKIELFDSLIEELIFRFTENSIFSAKYIKKLITEILSEFDDRIVVENTENSKIYLSCMLTDYCNVIYVYMKDYFFNIKRSNEIFFKNQIIENKDLIGYTELFPLKENDLIEIYIKDKKIVEFEILKTNQISKFINNNFFIKFLLLSLIVCIFGYFILSNVYINSNFKNIENMFDRINKNKYNYPSNENILIKIEDKLRLMDNKYIYYSNKNVAKKEKLRNKISEEKKKNDIFKNVFEIKEKIKKMIKNREFLKAKNEYINIRAKLEDVSPDLLLDINKDIDDLDKLIMEQNNELFLIEEDIIKNTNILDNLIEKYKKSKFEIDIKDLEDKKNNNIKLLDDLKIKLDNRYLKIDDILEKNILEGLKEIIYLKNEYDKLKFSKEVEYLSKRELEISDKILNLENEMNELYNKHKKYYDIKEYTTAISFLEKALYYANLLHNNNKIKELEGRIRLIYKQKRKLELENKKKIENPKEKLRLENEIRQSIKLSIEKGDELLKNDEYEKAFIEYKRAIELMDKVNYSKSIKKDIDKKMEYIKKKKSKKWWELWK